MLDIVEKFNDLKRREKAERDELDRKIEEREAQLKRLQKRRDNVTSTNWIDGIVKPLAEALAVHTGLPCTICGPFGLSCETSIYLFEDADKSICEQKTRSIRIIPVFKYNDSTVVYDTGEKSGKYADGTIGATNNLDRVTRPLPDSIEEIVALLIESEGVNID